jgi:hypothetical protein
VTLSRARVWSEVGYNPSHQRTAELCGRARELPCVWCGVVGPTNAWSFDYRVGDRTRVCPQRGLLYSCSPWDYSVRSGRCHRIWDALNTCGRVPVVEAAGWLLDRIEAHGGEVSSSVINAEAAAAGIPRTRLSAARRLMTSIESIPAHGRAQNARIWRLPEVFEIGERAETG